MLRWCALASGDLLHLAAVRVDGRWLLHHLRQQLLGLVAWRGPFLLLVLLLSLHPAIVKGVHSCVGAAVHASVGGVQPLRLRRDRVGDVLPIAPALEVFLRHRHIAAAVER